MEIIKTASAAEVTWVYLANEHASKQGLSDVVEQLRLAAESYPEGLSVEHLLSEIVGKDVRGTARQLSQLCWELRRISIADLGQVQAHVPGAPLPAPLKESFAGWREYLKWPHDEARRARRHYDSVLGRVRAGKLFRYRPIVRRAGTAFVVADGRHRLFAFWEEYAAIPAAAIEVYWEVPCSHRMHLVWVRSSEALKDLLAHELA